MSKETDTFIAKEIHFCYREIPQEDGSIDYFITARNTCDEHIGNITMHYHQVRVNESDNYALLPAKEMNPVVEFFHKHFVEKEVGGFYYDEEKFLVIVLLKPNWKDYCTKIS